MANILITLRRGSVNSVSWKGNARDSFCDLAKIRRDIWPTPSSPPPLIVLRFSSVERLLDAVHNMERD